MDSDVVTASPGAGNRRRTRCRHVSPARQGRRPKAGLPVAQTGWPCTAVVHSRATASSSVPAAGHSASGWRPCPSSPPTVPGPAGAAGRRRDPGTSCSSTACSYPAVRWNAGRAWRVVLPQVFGIFREQPSPRQRQIAALLWAGPEVGAVRRDGGPAARRDVGRPARDRVHVAGAGTAAQPHQRVRRGAPDASSTTPDAVTRGPLRLSSPARVGSRRRSGRPCARTTPGAAILIEAVQRGITTVDDLEEWVLRLRPRDAVPLRGPLAEAASGAWSVPEAELLDLVATSSRAPGTRGPTLMLTTSAGAPAHDSPDVWFDDVGSGRHGALAAPPQRGRPSGTTRSRRTQTSSRRESSSPAVTPRRRAPAAGCRARPPRAGVPRGAGTPSTGGAGDAATPGAATLRRGHGILTGPAGPRRGHGMPTGCTQGPAWAGALASAPMPRRGHGILVACPGPKPYPRTRAETDGTRQGRDLARGCGPGSRSAGRAQPV